MCISRAAQREAATGDPVPSVPQSAGERDGLPEVPRALLRAVRPDVTVDTRCQRPVPQVLRTAELPRL